MDGNLIFIAGIAFGAIIWFIIDSVFYAKRRQELEE